MSSPTRETVLEERNGAFLLLTLNRPRQRNAFDRQMWHELRDALRDAQEDAAVRAVIVTGTAFDKPLLAAVNGVGVGLTLLLHSDVVYISAFFEKRPPDFSRR